MISFNGHSITRVNTSLLSLRLIKFGYEKSPMKIFNIINIKLAIIGKEATDTTDLIKSEKMTLRPPC